MYRVRAHRRLTPRQSLRALGFTLLEVMVSLGILAIALMAIGDINGGAVRMHAYGKNLTVAVQLARGKMLDVQQLLIKEGLSDFSKEYTGTFEDEGWPEYKWTAKVIKPDFDINTSTLLDKVSGGLGIETAPDGSGGLASIIGNMGGSLGALTGGGNSAAGGPSGAGGPLAALGPFAGILQSQIQSISESIKDSVREIRLTVSWKAGQEEESFDVVQHVVILPNAQQNADMNAQAKTAQGVSGAAASFTNPVGTQDGTNPLLQGAPGGIP